MEITLSQKQLSDLIMEVTGRPADEIKLLEAMYRRFKGGTEALIEEKIKLLVGQGLEHSVRGVSFEDRQDIVKEIQLGDTLTFQHQPDNPQDSNAIGVFFRDAQIGFLPKEDAPLLKEVAPGVIGKVTKVGPARGSPFWGVAFVYLRNQTVKPVISINYDAINVALDSLDGEQMGREKVAMTEVLDRVSRTAVTKTEPKKKKAKKTEEISMDENVEASAPVFTAVEPAVESAPQMEEKKPEKEPVAEAKEPEQPEQPKKENVPPEDESSPPQNNSDSGEETIF